MRPLVLNFSLSVLLASHAGAQTQTTPSTDAGSTPKVQVTAPDQPFKFWSYEAESISGGYKLSNGWRMKVEAAPDGIVARIDKRRPVRLVAVSRDRYISPDGNMLMEFNRGTQGDEMMMSYTPDQRTAQVIVATATMAFNR